MLSLLTTSTCTIKRAAITSGARNPATAPTVLSGLAVKLPNDEPHFASSRVRRTFDRMTWR